MREIEVPKINTNDSYCTLLKWHVSSGDVVSCGTIIATLETSKTTYDLESPINGIVELFAEEAQECAFGSTVGYIFESDAQRNEFLKCRKHDNASTTTPEDTEKKFIVTQKAQASMEKFGLTIDDLGSLNKGTIKSSDIEAFVQSQRTAQTVHDSNDPSLVPFSTAQRGVANVVMRSHTSIPPAYLLVKVYTDKARRALTSLSKQKSVLVGLPELFVMGLAAARDSFPQCFAEKVDKRHYKVAQGCHAAVTVDTGNGLYMPVIRDIQTKSLDDVARELIGFREKALTGSFKADDLEGANIAVSLNMGRDIIAVFPIVYPQHTCIVSISGPSEELTFDEGGELSTTSYMNFGMTYDHTMLNGFDAMQFVKFLKELIEEDLDRLLGTA